MKHLKHHALHSAMCAPMPVVGAVLIASGRSLAVLIPIVGCVAMMGLMMAAMSHGGSNTGGR